MVLHDRPMNVAAPLRLNTDARVVDASLLHLINLNAAAAAVPGRPNHGREPRMQKHMAGSAVSCSFIIISTRPRARAEQE